MIKDDVFIIRGIKDIIFRKEDKEEESKQWVTFDPGALEFYTLNTVGAEIFYCISKNLSIKETFNCFKEKYDISSKEFKEIYSEFLEENVLTKYVSPLMLLSNLDERELNNE